MLRSSSSVTDSIIVLNNLDLNIFISDWTGFYFITILGSLQLFSFKYKQLCKNIIQFHCRCQDGIVATYYIYCLKTSFSNLTCLKVEGEPHFEWLLRLLVVALLQLDLSHEQPGLRTRVAWERKDQELQVLLLVHHINGVCYSTWINAFRWLSVVVLLVLWLN